jgi:hypothetical protein
MTTPPFRWGDSTPGLSTGLRAPRSDDRATRHDFAPDRGQRPLTGRGGGAESAFVERSLFVNDAVPRSCQEKIALVCWRRVRLRGAFQLQARDAMEIKGQGEMHTFLLTDAEAISGPAA